MSSYISALMSTPIAKKPEKTSFPEENDKKEITHRDFRKTIFEHQGFFHLYMGSFKEDGDTYVITRAVVEYKNRWYFMPSHFSSTGNIWADTCPSWKVKEKNINYTITTLDKKIAEQFFPGYM